LAKDELTQKQEAFCLAYIETGNASEAYRRSHDVGADTKPESIWQSASRVMSDVKVLSRIAELRSAAADRAEITQERVLRELGKIGFADIRKAVKWGDGLAVADIETGEVRIANGVALVGSEDIDDETAAAIAEISQTKEGLKVKFHDKKGALVDIGRHLGMFKDDKDKAGDIHIHFDGLLKGVL
jgi:phage terminase small subunit